MQECGKKYYPIALWVDQGRVENFCRWNAVKRSDGRGNLHFQRGQS
jgi:hypothetical protein